MFREKSVAQDVAAALSEQLERNKVNMPISLYVFDIIFFVLFTLAVVFFLYTRKKGLQRQGWIYLYRTQIGIKFIDWTSKRFPKTPKKLQYLIIICGYLLMAAMIYLLIKVSWSYLSSPALVRALKVPIIAPLVPYLPELFHLDFLPPFYFTYWIIIIAIIAVPHEFAHGIFARLNKIKIHSTGFGFLGPFLAAFVEQDDKQMNKASKFSQLSVLAAGTFANVLMTLLFGIIMALFFLAAFSPSGVIFNTYAIKLVNVSDVSYNNLSLNSSLIPIQVQNQTYYTSSATLEETITNNLTTLPVYENSPAFNAKLEGVISYINGIKITSLSSLTNELAKHSPGDKIIVTTLDSNGTSKDYQITLAEKGGKAYLGIGFIPQQGSGLFSRIYSLIGKIKDPTVYYTSSLGEFGTFIYNLLWWIILVSLSVALVNMLPLGMFDGGRFFYLTIWSLTGKEKIGKWAYKISTYLILVIVVALMLQWVFAFF